MKWLKKLIDTKPSENRKTETVKRSAEYVGENFGRALKRLADR